MKKKKGGQCVRIESWDDWKRWSAFLPYEEAKKVVNALGLKSRDDWKRWSRTERPPDIPRTKIKVGMDLQIG